jgi:hypothetical protein
MAAPLKTAEILHQKHTATPRLLRGIEYQRSASFFSYICFLGRDTKLSFNQRVPHGSQNGGPLDVGAEHTNT